MLPVGQLPKSKAVRFTTVSRFATAMGSSSFPTRATFILRASCPCAAATYGPIRWWMCTGRHRSFRRCTRRKCSGEGVESVNSVTFAADPAPGPSHTQVMRWKAIRFVFIDSRAIEIADFCEFVLPVSVSRRFGIEGLIQVDPENPCEERNGRRERNEQHHRPDHIFSDPPTGNGPEQRRDQRDDGKRQAKADVHCSQKISFFPLKLQVAD